MGPSDLKTPETNTTVPPKFVATGIDVTELIKAKYEKGYARAESALAAIASKQTYSKPVLAGEGLMVTLKHDHIAPLTPTPLNVHVKGGKAGQTESINLRENKVHHGDFALSVQFGRDAGAQALAMTQGIAMNKNGRVFVSPAVAQEMGLRAN